MKKIKYLVLILMILVFLSGLGILLYPYIQGYLVDRQIERTAEEFLSRVETAPISPYPSESQLDQDTPSDSPEPTGPDTYTDLWRDMVDYNKEIYINGQKGLDCKLAYEGPSFILADYGLESEVFAVISIPALELEMPVFLGANYRHMADGAAILSQTSIPSVERTRIVSSPAIGDGAVPPTSGMWISCSPATRSSLRTFGKRSSIGWPKSRSSSQTKLSRS